MGIAPNSNSPLNIFLNLGLISKLSSKCHRSRCRGDLGAGMCKMVREVIKMKVCVFVCVCLYVFTLDFLGLVGNFSNNVRKSTFVRGLINVGLSWFG